MTVGYSISVILVDAKTNKWREPHLKVQTFHTYLEVEIFQRKYLNIFKSGRSGLQPLQMLRRLDNTIGSAAHLKVIIIKLYQLLQTKYVNIFQPGRSELRTRRKRLQPEMAITENETTEDDERKNNTVKPKKKI